MRSSFKLKFLRTSRKAVTFWTDQSDGSKFWSLDRGVTFPAASNSLGIYLISSSSATLSSSTDSSFDSALTSESLLFSSLLSSDWGWTIGTSGSRTGGVGVGLRDSSSKFS